MTKNKKLETLDLFGDVRLKLRFMDYRFSTSQKGYPKFYFEVGINHVKGW